jgi:hypothetical protein
LLAGSLYKQSKDRFLRFHIILEVHTVGDGWLEIGERERERERESERERERERERGRRYVLHLDFYHTYPR